MSLRKENPRTGFGCIPEQEAYRLEFKKAYDISMGHVKREMLHIIAVPRWHVVSVRGEKKRYVHKPLGQFVHNDDVEFLMMWDRQFDPLTVKPNARKMETIALLQHARISKGKVVVRGGRGSGGGTIWVDFGKPMYQTHQASLEARGIGNLSANLTGRPGRLRIVHEDNRIDICLDRLPNGAPAIMYRFEAIHFEGPDPRAVLLVGSLPADGETIDAGMVEPDTHVVKLRKPCEYTQAIVRDGRFKLEFGRPPYSWDLSDEHHLFLFGLCNEMNKIMNDVALGGHTELVEDPGSWAPEPMVEFSPSVFDALTAMPAFQISPELMTDMISGLRPSGDFRLTAQFSGTIFAVEPLEWDPTMWRILYDTGQEQLVPDFCTLTVAENDVVKRGDPIGWPLSTGFYTPDSLDELMGQDMWWLIEAFLQSKAVYPEQSKVPGVLLNLRYARPMLEYATSSDLYWDFRKAHARGAQEGEILMLPPMRYRGGSEVKVGDITFRVGTPPPTHHPNVHTKGRVEESAAA